MRMGFKNICHCRVCIRANAGNPEINKDFFNKQPGLVLRTATAGNDRVRGFTLIELLVVVLIIGILAAVALPQYRKAVDKSRIAQYISLGRSFSEAMDRYYLANGTEVEELEDLDISLSGAWWTPPSQTDWTDGQARIGLNSYSVPEKNIFLSNKNISSYLTLEFFPNYVSNKKVAGKIDCCDYKGSYGAQLCKTFGRYAEDVSDEEYDCYWIE